MSLVRNTPSERKYDERRSAEVEKKAVSEAERTVKAAAEHRKSVQGDAKRDDAPQRVADRHRSVEVNTFGREIKAKAQTPKK